MRTLGKIVAYFAGLIATLAIVVATHDPIYSGYLWLKAEKPAGCFARGGFVGGPSWCQDWRHCSKNEDKNLARGYSCLGFNNPGRDIFDLMEERDQRRSEVIPAN